MSSATVRVAISVTSGSLALCFNTLLAIVIITTKCSYIGNYKYLLLLYTINAAVYSIGQMTTAATFMLFPEGYMLYDTVHLLPVTFGYIAVNIYLFSYVANVVILVLSFSYRYFVICSPGQLQLFIKNWMGVVIVSLAITAYVFGVLVYGLMPSSQCEELFGEKFHQSTGHSIIETGYNGGIVFYHGQFQWKFAFALGTYTIFALVAAGIILFAAVKTAKKLKTVTAESVSMAHQQKKIFTLLIFQISLPWIFNMIPVNFTLVAASFHIPADVVAEYTGCILSIAQIVDPLLTFHYIKPYRIALWGRLCQSTVSYMAESGTVEQQRSSNRFGHSSPF